MAVDWKRMMRGARTILDDCASVKAGEQVLIVTDTELVKIGRALEAIAYERDAEPVLMMIRPRDMDGQEPPDSVAEAMKRADVVLAPVSRSITHTRAVKEAASAGARILVMTAFTERLMTSGGIEADFRAQRPVCLRLAELFTEASTVRLTTPAGTDLDMDIRGRRGNALTCVVDEPGMFSPVPNVEANVSPVEGSTEGVIVVDASVPYIGIGLLREPVRMRVEGGFITEIRGGEQADALRRDLEEKDDPNVYNIAELGVGLNPKSRMTGVMLDDEGVLGSAHIGIGTNITLGGRVKAAVHYDLVIWRPTIELDGQRVTEEGKIKFRV
ncbi:MAG: leucyl aminopeptidase [Candidatus Bathyarchaeota archaeon]|nr:leucyl aminopeptidase [Candidatus Bathyarchaeota archaeon]